MVTVQTSECAAPVRGLARAAQPYAHPLGAEATGLHEGSSPAGPSLCSRRFGLKERVRCAVLAQEQDWLWHRSRTAPRPRARAFLSLAFAPWSDERGENRTGEQELQGCRETPRAVPAEPVVKELPSTRTQEGEDVLEIGGGARRRAEGRRIERASPRGEEDDAPETADDLDSTRVDVPVRHAIAREVENRT